MEVMLEIAKCSNVESEEPTFDVVVVVVDVVVIVTLHFIHFQDCLQTFVRFNLENIIMLI